MNDKKKYRNIIFYEDHFEKFFVNQRKRVKDKIIWTLSLIEELPIVPETYLKHIKSTNGLYEIRIKDSRDIFRIFCFFDSGKLIVLMNGFQKKSQKTPKNDLEKALKIKDDYERNKR